jgi:hypothetical protein
MAMASEYTFTNAVRKAEGIRQAAKAAAFATWAFGQGAALTTYVTALETADNTYIASVNSAASTLGVIGSVYPGQLGPGGAAPLGSTVIGSVGMSAITRRFHRARRDTGRRHYREGAVKHVTWNSVEIVSFKNIAATPAPFTLRGGSYGVTVHATFGGGSVTLQRLAPDGSTFVTVLAAFSADGYSSVNLPAGSYELAIATATAVYADIVGIVTTM